MQTYIIKHHYIIQLSSLTHTHTHTHTHTERVIEVFSAVLISFNFVSVRLWLKQDIQR